MQQFHSRTMALGAMIGSLICSSGWAGSFTETKQDNGINYQALYQTETKSVNSMVVIPAAPVSNTAAPATVAATQASDPSTRTLAEQTKIVSGLSGQMNSLAGQIPGKRTQVSKETNVTEKTVLQNELKSMQKQLSDATNSYNKELDQLLAMRKNPQPLKSDLSQDIATVQSVSGDTVGKLNAQTGQTPSVALNAAGLFYIKDSLITLRDQFTDSTKKKDVQKILDAIAVNPGSMHALIAISDDEDGTAAAKLQAANGTAQYGLSFEKIAISRDGRSLWLTVPAASIHQ